MSSRQPKRAKSKTREVIAIVADVVRSRTSADRVGLQKVLVELAEELNREHGTAMVAKFEISQGDSIAGLLNATGPALCEIAHELLTQRVPLRTVFSRGEVFDPISNSPAQTDGPAWWQARESLDKCKKRYGHGPIFVGFGEQWDLILTAMGQSISERVRSWTLKQSEITLAKLELGQSARVAAQLKLTPAQVSKTLAAIGYRSFQDMRDAFDALADIAIRSK